MNKNTIKTKRKYFPSEIEPKWRQIWEKEGINKFKENKGSKGKYYNLVELPYPSGDLHLGHWFSFALADVHARHKRMIGYDVFFPNGFDAFGLPAENAAIKRGVHPKDWTMKNIENMRKQFATMGTMIDWDYTAITCLPDYYKWNQWIFLKMFEKGIAYRGTALSNWCETDKTVLANEHIEGGKCWRCGNEVVQKEVEQWFLKITNYADELIWPQDPKVDWPKEVREGQNNWIGRSEGMLLDFEIVEKDRQDNKNKKSIKVFTTRPDTTDGATFMVIAPEHEFAAEIDLKDVSEYIKMSRKKTEMERKEDRTKSGIFTGRYVVNPVTDKQIPVWISDYVLAGYGTGAIMAVPFADERDREFAEKFKLPIIPTSFKSKPKGEKKVNYHLRDWSISRQRYWGTPVPIIHCESCGLVPVLEKDLPVELPYNVDYTPKGKPPLATDEQWLTAKCPKCGTEGAKRDAETLDTFFDSAWYYYRYVSPNYNNGPFEKSEVSKLMPVDVYVGGAEHTLGHTLYARFFTKFFKDLGLVGFEEFAKKRVQHGVILGPDGNRMSKSRGNVVNPDDVVKEYGTDTVRLYLSFMMPYEATAPWSTGAISGIYRFLKRIWEMSQNLEKMDLSTSDYNMMHRTIKKVGEDIDSFSFNTAVSTLMTWLNYLTEKGVSKQEFEVFLKLIAPFAPHFAEELYHSVVKSDNSVHLQEWPSYQSKYLTQEAVQVVVQVNGKLRDTVLVYSPKLKEQKLVEDLVKQSENVSKYLSGQKIRKVIYIEGKLINFVI